MAVTIKQVAAAAGVSRGTVDRVLHNRGGVRPDVEEHIRNVAQNMGYFPNKAGKFLAARKQPITIGYVLPGAGNMFFDDVIKGCEMAQVELQDFGVTVKIKELRGYKTEEHIRAIREMAEDANALCVSTIDTPDVRACVDEIAERIPVVTVNTDLTGTRRLCYVGSDYLAAGRTSAGLLALCKRDEALEILIATGSLRIKGHNDRIKGFQQALKKRKVTFDVAEIFETQDDDETACQGAAETLKRRPDINCVYITGAGVAGVCRAVEELPPKRRRALHVICFDDTAPVKKYVKKGIIDFSVCQEPKTQGYQAIKKLFDYFLDGGRGQMSDYITKAVIKIDENMNMWNR